MAIQTSSGPSSPLRRSSRIQAQPSRQLLSPPRSQAQAQLISKTRRDESGSKSTKSDEYTARRRYSTAIVAGQKRKLECMIEDNGHIPQRPNSRDIRSSTRSVESPKQTQRPEPSLEPTAERADTLPLQEAIVKEAGIVIRDPISWWVSHSTWPPNFATFKNMAASEPRNKRSRSGNAESDSRTRSYSQSRKDGSVPEQYTPAYEKYIITRGLQMDTFIGRDSVDPVSATNCTGLQNITLTELDFPSLTKAAIEAFLRECRGRNEGIVHRDITPLIIPPICLLRVGGVENLEHVVDEVKADWYERCVIAGPRPRPDLAIGLSSTGFSQSEINKLISLKTSDNWTQFTTNMFFPFLMCEVKCGLTGLDYADRQNMHSCSVAVRALLHLYQAANKQPSAQKLKDPHRRILVFSISHDQQDARLYGHFARRDSEDRWTYHRYLIRKFDLLTDGLLALHNFVLNLFKSYLPDFIKNIKDCVEALPEPSDSPIATPEIAPENNLQEAPSSALLPSSQETDNAADSLESLPFQLPGEPASASMQREMELMRRQMEQLKRLVEEKDRQINQLK